MKIVSDMREKIHRSYVISTTLRSGSWMLCAALTRTGIAGKPSEYFGQTLWEELTVNRTHVKYETTERFLDTVIRASTTENGVFGTKLPANHTHTFLRRASEHAGCEYRSLKEALETEFPNIMYIYLTREDKTAQAVSLYKAVMTGAWRGARTPFVEARLRELEYDQYGIERCYQDIVAADAYWDGYFATHGIAPVCVAYEDLAAAYEETMRRLLRALGLPWHIEIPLAGTTRLANERSREWAERFRNAGRFPKETSFSPERLWAPY